MATMSQNCIPIQEMKTETEIRGGEAEGGVMAAEGGVGVGVEAEAEAAAIGRHLGRKMVVATRRERWVERRGGRVIFPLSLCWTN